MSRIIEIPITNFPAPRIYDGSVRDEISAFDSRLLLLPVQSQDVQKVVRGKSQRAFRTISAMAKIDESLTCELSSGAAQTVETWQLVAFMCDLLSLASRRAVNFKPHRSWWPGGVPVARGGFAARGPLMTNTEVANLLARGLPKLCDPAFATDRRMVTALRWFMAGYSIGAWEVKLTWLWSVLEMLAKAYWESRKPDMPTISAIEKKSHQRTVVDNLIEPFLKEIGIPPLNSSDLAFCINLHDLYTVRGHIIHGDPRMEADTIRLFGPYAAKRANELSHHAKYGVSNPINFGCCLYETVHLLSRLLEKVFFNLFDCKDSWYYVRLPYHTSCPP